MSTIVTSGADAATTRPNISRVVTSGTFASASFTARRGAVKLRDVTPLSVASSPEPGCMGASSDGLARIGAQMPSTKTPAQEQVFDSMGKVPLGIANRILSFCQTIPNQPLILHCKLATW